MKSNVSLGMTGEAVVVLVVVEVGLSVGALGLAGGELVGSGLLLNMLPAV